MSSNKPPVTLPRSLLLVSLVALGLGIAAPLSANPPMAPELTAVWWPEPQVVSAPEAGVPSDAIVLFDGSSLDGWESINGGPAPWKLEDGAMVIEPRTRNIASRKTFGDIQLHLEFRSPAEVVGSGQGRGNSGVFLMGLYEVQILDSYENRTYVNGQAASIYKQHIPLVNASRPPGTWQTYDIIFIAPRFDGGGDLISPARMTVFHNGVLVHYDAVLQGATTNRGYPAYTAHASRLPIVLQDHGDRVAFRNIWVRELLLPARGE